VASPLPQLLESVLEPDPRATIVPRATLLSASATVEGAIEAFLSELLSRGCDRLLMERAVMLPDRNVLLASLRETIGEFVSAVDPSTRPGSEDVLVPMLLRLAGSLHFAPSRATGRR
jgi:hypothetical protein